jgi:hypothetical protein
MAVETYAMYNDQQLSAASNQIKELIVTALIEKGLVAEDDGTSFLEHYAVVVVKKGWLGASIDRVLGFKQDDDKKFQLVRLS